MSGKAHVLTRLKILGGIFVSLTFARSAVYHIENPFAFLRTIESYRILSPFFCQVAAAFLPILMISLSLALLFANELRRTAFIFSAVVSFSFVFAQATVLFRGIEIDCGCFGSATDNLIGFRSIALPSAIGCVSSICLFGRFDDETFATIK